MPRGLRREFDVDTAIDAADALARIADDLHAVVTDHDLGHGKPDERTVLAEVRRRVPSAKRILISGERQEMGSGEPGLWHARLVKPITRDELLAALRGLGSK